jgi:hypothetical protein
MAGAVWYGGSAVFRSRSLSSGYRVANLAETAGEVAALEVSQQAAVGRQSESCPSAGSSQAV